MANETKIDTKDITAAAKPLVAAAAQAATAPAKAAAKVAEAVVEANTKAVRGAKRASTVRKAKRKIASAPRKIKTAAREAAAVAKEGINPMFNKTKTASAFPQFDAMPTFAPFQSMFSQAGDRGQDMAQKSQKVAEELADLTRANVEAMVEAGRVMVEGARSIGQDAVSTSRDGAEKAADAIRTLAEAKSPTEFMQLQGDFARASFDRMVNESSRMTESFVKLAGEAFQPLQNRASANAERFNTLVA